MSRIKVAILVGATVAIALAIAIPIVVQRQTDDPIMVDQADPHDGAAYRIVEEAYWGVPTEGESARRADLIAVAEVNEQLPAFWNTANKQRPDLIGLELLKSPQYGIYTPYKLQITQAIKGEIVGDGTIQLNRIGGQIDNDVVSVEDDLFELKPGTRIVVFLRDCGEERAVRSGSPGSRYRIN